jgi:putative ATP-dependent endonuclease of OLD family
MRLNKITIENFRGIAHATIELHRDITVLIGENNVGKTSVLEALRFCLDVVKSDKACNFTEFDFHRDTATTALSSCPPIILTLEFRETADHLWLPEITQNLSEVIVGDDLSVIKLRVTAEYDAGTNELSQKLAFLDDADNEMPKKSGHIQDLRRLRPFFFQRALRAAKDEFSSQSAYWSSFLNNKDIDDLTRRTLEAELSAITQKVVNAHGSFKQVADEVKRLSDFVAVGKVEAVTVDSVTPDIYKTLRYGTEVNLLTASNAKIPLRSHGEGTQSLAVLLLFNAYLKTRLKDETDRNASPIIAIEEPEAHLHPSAVRAVWQVLKDLPGQKIVATHSGDILSEVPLESIRRVSQKTGCTQVFLSEKSAFTAVEERKLAYHIRAKRGNLLFAKSWLLVEGETEFWFLPEAAHYLGHDFDRESVCCVEFAQCGLEPLIKLAQTFGIEWHIFVDNDQAGQDYVKAAKRFLGGIAESERITVTSKKDIEHELWEHSYSSVYESAVSKLQKQNITAQKGTSDYIDQTIKRAINSTSKPNLAIAVIDAIKRTGSSGLPNTIKHAIEQSVENAQK